MGRAALISVHHPRVQAAAATFCHVNVQSAVPARFVCFTAYHLLMAETIARQAGILDAEVVWTDEPGLGRVVDEIVSDGPLRIVLRLAPIGATRGWARSLIYATNRRSLRRWLPGRTPGPLYVFNPLRPESRAVAERLGRTLHFVEDGLEAYGPGAPTDRRARWLRRAASTVMGVRPFLKRNFIEYGAWHEGWALLPDRIYPPPRTTLPPIQPVAPAILNAVIERWGESVQRDLAVGSCAVLAMLDHPVQAAGLTVERAVDAASGWGIGADQVLIKPHPRDHRPLTAITEGFAVKAIDGRWPVESMFSVLRGGAIVLGGNSSGMLVAAVLRPDLDLRPRAAENSPLWRLLQTLDARVRLEPIFDA